MSAAQTTTTAPTASPAPAPEFSFRGSLEAEEIAALTAVLQAVLCARAATDQDAQPDRTLLRRQQLGLWARPGEGQWRQAAGQL